MRAEIEIECKDPEKIISAIMPDASPSDKFSARLDASGRRLLLRLEAKDVTGLMTGINSYMRLIRAAMDVEGVEK